MSEEGLERLIDSLLYEGYALYPYTPGTTKNSTPTPFGIAYPPDYAAHQATTFDLLRMECLLDAGEGAEIDAEVRFLQPQGERHKAEPRRAALPPAPVDALAEAPIGQEFRFEPLEGSTLDISLELSAEPLGAGRVRVRLVVRNLTAGAGDADRAGALRSSLLSTHPLLRVRSGRFVSPLEAGSDCDSVNTWPVLAAPDDDVILGAAIVLPDHPSLAPESLGNLFDSTEIEEALLLHVQVLSDEERASIAQQDPAVREMIERAERTTPQEMLALHGRTTLRDPVTSEPPVPSADVRDPTRGEQRTDVDGKVFVRGGKVVLRPPEDADLHARMCAGRTATIERIFIDYDGRVHLGVTVDDDPGQELLRETGRFLFFFPPEVEVVAP